MGREVHLPTCCYKIQPNVGTVHQQLVVSTGFQQKLLDLLVKLDQFPEVDVIIKRYVKVATRLKLNTKK